MEESMEGATTAIYRWKDPSWMSQDLRLRFVKEYIFLLPQT